MSSNSTVAPSIYSYMDYRAFLHDFYKYQKSLRSSYSYQFIADRVGIDRSLVMRIFSGKRHLSQKSVDTFITFLGLNKKEALYFIELISYCKAEKDEDIKRHMDKLLFLTPTNQRILRSYEFKYFQQWYYAAIRSLLGYYHFTDDYRELAQTLKPKISVPEAREAISLLQKLDLIKRLSDGRFVPTSNHISTGERWRSMAIEKYQVETIALSHDGLKRHPKSATDYSTITMSMNEETITEIRGILKECRQKIINLVNSVPEEEINTLYQLNMQVFPLVNVESKG